MKGEKAQMIMDSINALRDVKDENLVGMACIVDMDTGDIDFGLSAPKDDETMTTMLAAVGKLFIDVTGGRDDDEIIDFFVQAGEKALYAYRHEGCPEVNPPLS